MNYKKKGLGSPLKMSILLRKATMFLWRYKILNWNSLKNKSYDILPMRVFSSTISWYFLDKGQRTCEEYDNEGYSPAMIKNTRSYWLSSAWYTNYFRIFYTYGCGRPRSGSACTRSLGPQRICRFSCLWFPWCADFRSRSILLHCKYLFEQMRTLHDLILGQIHANVSKNWTFLK